MKYIKVNPESTRIKRENWQKTFNKYLPELASIPAVRSGSTSMDDAKNWLECVSKTHSDSLVATCIKQSKGLGARDIRALVAHDSEEYYPALSANEIYQSKQLKAYPANFNLAKNEEPFIINAARQVLEERHNVTRSTSHEDNMLNGKNGLWLKSKPSLYGNINGNDVVIDIHINRGKDVTHSDELRLHYHNLVATSINLEPTSLFQVNLQIDPSFKEKLVEMASISPAAEQAAIQIIKEAIINKADTVEMSTRVIQQNQNTYEKLAITGQTHWEQITSGAEIKLNNERDELPEELAEEYTQISKMIVVAKNLKDKAQEIETQARAEMTDFAALNGIASNMKLPYEATTLKQNKKYDLKELFDILTTRHGVPATSLKKVVVDVDTHMHVLNDAIKNNTHITVEQLSSSIKYEGLDEASIKTAATDTGLNLDDYADVAMKVYFSPQSRGDVFNAMQGIKNEIGTTVNHVANQLINSPVLDDERLKQNLSNTGISHHMDF